MDNIQVQTETVQEKSTAWGFLRKDFRGHKYSCREMQTSDNVGENLVLSYDLGRQLNLSITVCLSVS